ncbi:DUF2867 domain-containing protein [Streptomyces sp. PmtG]
MKVPNSAHTSRGWRIHELTPDFRLEDVWVLPTPGGADDFPRLLDIALPDGQPTLDSPIARALFAIRWKLGALLGWDKPDAGIGSRTGSLLDRLPKDLRESPSALELHASPFTPLYQLENEFAAEMGNRTVHAVMHLGWVPDGKGGYRGQMAVLVKANGPLGRAYMMAIAPFRHLFVYPVLMREYEKRWRETGTAREAG